ncbi:Lipase (class 2) [Acrodontium crateriforme]|uniref:Lipase (Class 2) n=1 Tax=Acrodontium crateriforme TaxID=150365 RepID=A0AAQ3LZG2_9PEZI|nr:Lipase (class 2) [Acrodontium crateriforme]
MHSSSTSYATNILDRDDEDTYAENRVDHTYHKHVPGRSVRSFLAFFTIRVHIMLKQSLVSLLLTAAAALASPIVARAGHNDFTCRSTTHPNPVVLLHGLGATYYEDINLLDSYLQGLGFCTFSLTYGAEDPGQYVGGLQHVPDSAAQIAAFVRQVQTNTGATKVDLVGHSEGAFQTLYVTKFEAGIKDIVQRVVAIAPPTHGTDFLLYVYALTYLVAPSLSQPLVKGILDTFGCPACADLVQGADVVNQLNDGPIAQPGVSYTIIASKADELVTPVDTAFVREAGVTNVYVQDFCPLDPAGHIDEAYDPNVWALVSSSLEDNIHGPAVCVTTFPGK